MNLHSLSRIVVLPRFNIVTAAILLALLTLVSATFAADPKPDPTAEATTEAEMKPYREFITGTVAKFDMVPIPGGKFMMGSPDSEAERSDDEGPQHEVEIKPFWMGKTEVTWDEYDVWNHSLDIKRRMATGQKGTDRDKIADAVTRPTKPYTDMTFGMGHDGYPAICMTQLAAKTYCEWLTAKTGHYYRLPTEAEWEYACRAGTTTAYSFGDDPEQLDDYAWYVENSDEKTQPVGKKKPNPWGLYDMHGNVMEWTLDALSADFYAESAKQSPAILPFNMPTKLYPHAVRGGSWEDDPSLLRSAARVASDKDWKIQDPQIPKSRWYHTDALFVGFRIIRPLVEDSPELKIKYKGTGDEQEDN